MHKLMIAKLFLALSSIAIIGAAGFYADRRDETSEASLHMAAYAPARVLVEPAMFEGDSAALLASARDTRS
ncbi:hypothetical protein [Ancylobacter sp. G4_0304]|uniref:hypothetical protein n=1 Tax=Ancylobacter sp. G4_0304 TaxID=3114289 RepID=UPI0039C74A1B